MSEPASRHGRTVGRAAVRHFVGPAKPRPAAPHTPQPPADPTTRLLPMGEVTRPVFVDHSGRRGRVVRRVLYLLIVVALLLLALLWLSQALVVGVEVP